MGEKGGSASTLLTKITNSRLNIFSKSIFEKLYIIDLNQLTVSELGNIEYRRLVPEDFGQLFLEDYSLNSKFIRQAFERNDYCIGAFKNNQLIAHGWAANKVNISLNDTHCVQYNHKDYLYVYKTFIQKDFQNTGLLNNLLCFYQSLPDLGNIEQLLLSASRYDHDSIQHYEALNPRIRGAYFSLCCLNVQIARYLSRNVSGTTYSVLPSKKPFALEPSGSFNITLLTGEDDDFIKPLIQSRLNITSIIQLAEIDTPNHQTHKIKFFLKKLKKWTYELAEHIHAKRFRHFLSKHGIAHQYAGWQELDKIHRILEHDQPDLVIVYLAPLFPERLLNIPKLGMINLHPALLPNYRGGNPILWPALEFNLVGGSTVHFLNNKIDDGDILAQQTFRVPLGAHYYDVYDKCIFDIGIELIITAAMKIQNNEPYQAIEQDKTTQTTFAKSLSPQEEWRAINWQEWSTQHIYHYLHFHEAWLKPLGLETGYRRFFEWTIKDYTIADHTQEPGTTQTNRFAIQLFAKDGCVTIKAKPNALHFIKTAIKSLIPV